jgi:hypothetical protein
MSGARRQGPVCGYPSDYGEDGMSDEFCTNPAYCRDEMTWRKLLAERDTNITILKRTVLKQEETIRRLLKYRAHWPSCEDGHTEFCTCGMKQAADKAHALLESTKSAKEST